MDGLRFSVERVCLDAVTGRLNGADMLLHQLHIKESAEKDGMNSLSLDTTGTTEILGV